VILIAIAGKNAIPVESLVDLQIALSSDLEREVDLVDLSAIEGLILSEIFRKGKVLIKKDPSLYACYMRKVIYFNEDMLPNIRMILEKRASRFANGK
jgi:hypothetical protein